jgi:hypothetical protein
MQKCALSLKYEIPKLQNIHWARNLCYKRWPGLRWSEIIVKSSLGIYRVSTHNIATWFEM